MRNTILALRIVFVAVALTIATEICLATGLTPRPCSAALNPARFPADRQRLQTVSNQRNFPRLGSAFEVLAPSTDRYNCISHSLGIHDEWIDPQTGPPDAPLVFMDRMYRSAGYRRLSVMDFSRRPGEKKVVVYGLRNDAGQITRVTHAAVQAADGSWNSKLGALALIRHAAPQALIGPEYGVPIAVYAR